MRRFAKDWRKCCPGAQQPWAQNFPVTVRNQLYIGGIFPIDGTKFKAPERLSRQYVGQESIWVEFVGLTIKNQALNLGQGFPNFFPPSHVIEKLSQTGDKYLLNQYTRGPGRPALVSALKDMYSPLLNRDLDQNKNILVTVGAYASLYAAIIGNVEAGEEVIIIEPFFDCYAPMVKLAGATPRFVALKPPADPKKAEDTANWYLDMDEFKALFNDKTKAVIVNNPHNPTGKVFTLDELNAICDVIKENDCLCIADEVYETNAMRLMSINGQAICDQLPHVLQ